MKNLQKFAGKTTSFALFVPAAKLYTNSVFLAISRAVNVGSRQINLSSALRKEISYWRFLDNWYGFLPWRDESHVQVQLFSDASGVGWGGCLSSPGQPDVVTRGYWNEADRQRPIAVKESLALRFTVESLLGHYENARAEVFVDNKVLQSSWEKQISRSSEISDIMKSVFQFSFSRNVLLSLHMSPPVRIPQIFLLARFQISTPPSI